MNKISALVITRNEENMIADCLDSVSFCDQVVVIDSGSTDRTKDIAKHVGADVYSHLESSFAKKREFALGKAKYGWVLYIDADERISADLAVEIKSLLQKRTIYENAFQLKRKNFYLGNHEWPYIEVITRLFKKSALSGWEGSLHETPKVDGEIGRLSQFLNHYTHRDFTSMVEKTCEWSSVEATLRYNSNHPKMSWWRFPRVMGTAFYDSYIRQKGYKAGTVGLLESLYQAFSIFISYARLWEMQATPSPQV